MLNAGLREHFRLRQHVDQSRAGWRANKAPAPPASARSGYVACRTADLSVTCGLSRPSASAIDRSARPKQEIEHMSSERED
jgi:hypothetical protein